jgi:NAD(P)-dependent dehydrogenase (short-subunit alcohol dehydrogenase family)
VSVRFEGRVALVTGAGRGLGLAHAQWLARRGCKVILNDIAGDEAPHIKAASALCAEGFEAFAVTGSVADRADARDLADVAQTQFGRVDILINNAGFLRDRSFRKMSLDDFDAIIDVHLRGAAYVTHAVWPLMLDQNFGRILNTTSTSALYGAFGQANYDAAKLGLVGLQNALKLEGRGRNVLVNTIAPLADTRLAGVFPDAVRAVMGLDWVAALACYLVSEACQETGLVLEIGAGQIASVKILETAGVAMKDASPEAAREALMAALSQKHEKGFDMAGDAVAKIVGAAL